MLRLLIVFSLVTAAGCDTSAEVATKVAREMVYMKDARTGLCFAYWQYASSPNSAVLANVPCDPKVVALIINDAERQAAPASGARP